MTNIEETANEKSFTTEPSKYWYALYTKPRHEFKAASYLNDLEIENYLPTVTRIKQWSDRKKKIIEPVFKGYIFIYGDEKERYNALQNDSIVYTISFEGKPARIPDWQIENLKKIITSEEELSVENLISEGTKVKIVDGPFSGVEGIVIQTDHNEKLLGVSIDLLRRTVLVRLPKTSVIKKV